MTTNTLTKYRHYKGGIYIFICEARFEPEPEVAMIVYQSADGSYWVRRKEVFFEEVLHEGKIVPRFARMD